MGTQNLDKETLWSRAFAFMDNNDRDLEILTKSSACFIGLANIHDVSKV